MVSNWWLVGIGSVLIVIWTCALLLVIWRGTKSSVKKVILAITLFVWLVGTVMASIGLADDFVWKLIIRAIALLVACFIAGFLAALIIDECANWLEPELVLVDKSAENDNRAPEPAPIYFVQKDMQAPKGQAVLGHPGSGSACRCFKESEFKKEMLPSYITEVVSLTSPETGERYIYVVDSYGRLDASHLSAELERFADSMRMRGLIAEVVEIASRTVFSSTDMKKEYISALVRKMRNPQSRSKRALLDEAADVIEELWQQLTSGNTTEGGSSNDNQ